MKIAVVGLGKAGLPLAAVIADSGIEVVGVDISKERVNEVNNGLNPIPEEEGLSELLKKHGGKTLVATTEYNDAKDCEAFIVIVPLFIDKDKKPDFSILKDAFGKLSGIIKDGDLVVLETTVPPNTTERILKPILDESGKNYNLAYSPERIMTGCSVSRYKEFPKIVGGINQRSGEKAYKLYSKFCTNMNLVSNIKTTEMIKVCEGIYRDMNIALANELFKVCEEENIDYYEVKNKANHEFCQLHLPGNVGGHCIPVYPWFLINGHEVPLIKKARELNDEMINYYADKLVVEKGKVAVLGLTYRDNVKELAYSRSIAMVELLKNKGYEVYANDPMLSEDEVEELGAKFTDDFESMDGLILMNNCSEYIERLKKIRNKVVDTKGVLN